MPAIGGFCFQQTGIRRVGPGGADPSLNVDPTRNGVEPDIAFTGASDGVPWVVWYEKDKGTFGLNENEMVFAAKGIKDEAAEGGFHWEAVGNQRNAMLDTAGTNEFGACARIARKTRKNARSTATRKKDAEDPRVAAGTMNPANPTVPWVTWDEDVEGVKQVFVSRLVDRPRARTSKSSTAERRSRPARATRPARTSRSRATRRTCPGERTSAAGS